MTACAAASPLEGFDPGSSFCPGLCALILHLRVTPASSFERMARRLAEVLGLTIGELTIANASAPARAPLLAAAAPLVATGRLHGMAELAAIRAALARQAVISAR